MPIHDFFDSTPPAINNDLTFKCPLMSVLFAFIRDNSLCSRAVFAQSRSNVMLNM